MTKYGIGKSSVLRLLDDNNVVMRRQGTTAEQAQSARLLYEEGKSLASAAKELDLPKQSVRVALIRLGVQMRPPTGGYRSREEEPLSLQ